MENYIASYNPYNEDALFIKLVVVGDAESGKTALTERFINNNFLDTLPSTLGVDIKEIEAKNSDRNIKFQIFDCSGQKSFRAILSTYYERADIFIVCIDLNNTESFNTVTEWINDIRKQNKKAEILLVGTKADLVAKNDLLNIQNRLKQALSFENHKIRRNKNFFITSAKENADVSLIFKKAGEIAIRRKLSFWRRHKRNILKGIIIGSFLITAITLCLTIPGIGFFLASIGITIPFTGYVATASLAGIGAIFGLIIGTFIAEAIFKILDIVKMARPDEVNKEPTIEKIKSSTQQVKDIVIDNQNNNHEKNIIHQSPIHSGSSMKSKNSNNSETSAKEEATLSCSNSIKPSNS